MTDPPSVRLFGEPELRTARGVVDLTPYQRAFLSIVFGEGQVSRPRVARLVWGREIDGRARSGIRQLRHQVNRRAGTEIIGACGDQLVAAAAVQSDVRVVEAHLSDDEPHAAAIAIARGFVTGDFGQVSSRFVDWRDDRDGSFRRRAEGACSDQWDRAIRDGDWTRAVEAAQALARLDGPSPEGYARLIEAHARAGYVREAEAAYSEYRRTCERDEQAEAMDSLMLRIRKMARESDATRGLDDIPFVGRQDALARLTAVVDTIGEGGCVLAAVTGEAGIGKTRLLHEIRRVATLDGIRCLRASPTSLEQRISLSPIFDALSTIDLMPHLEAIGEPWRSVATSMMPSRWDVGERREPPPIDDTALNRRLLESFALLLHSVAQDQPTLLIIDDLHWADTTTLSLLDFYRRRWAESSLGVLVAARTELVTAGSAVEELLGDGVELSELTPTDATALARHAAASDLNDESAQQICLVAGHHPLSIVELAAEWLVMGEGLPSIVGVVRRRLGPLGKVARDVALILAVAERPVGVAELTALSELDYESVGVAVGELASANLVRLDAGAVGFTHGLLRQAVCELAPAASLMLAHSRFADRLGPFADESELATHYSRAGMPELAARYAWIAAERAAALGAMSDAAELFRLAERNETTPSRKAEATAQQAQAVFLARDLEQRLPILALAADRLRVHGAERRALRADLQFVEAVLSVGHLHPTETLARLKTVKDRAATLDDWEAVSLALEVELRIAQWTNDRGLARAALHAMKDIAGRDRDPAGTVVCLMGLSMDVIFGEATGPFDAVSAAREAVRRTASGLPSYRLRALHRLLLALQLRGMVFSPETIDALGEARDLAARSGDVRTRLMIEHNRAVALLDSGELDRATALTDSVLGQFGSADMDLTRFNHFCTRGEIAIWEGQYDLGLAQLKMASTLLGPSTPEYAVSFVEAGIGLCALETGRLGESRRRERRLGQLTVPFLLDPSVVLEFRTRLLERRGEGQAATNAIVDRARPFEHRSTLRWLKLVASHARRATRWGQLDRATVERARDTAVRLGLERRSEELSDLVRTSQASC